MSIPASAVTAMLIILSLVLVKKGVSWASFFEGCMWSVLLGGPLGFLVAVISNIF